MTSRRLALIGAAVLALAATGVAIGGGTPELQGFAKTADTENALQMIDEQLALFDEAGVSKSDERYQELIRQRETILSSASQEPTPADKAVAALGGHQPATEIASKVGDCEAIPGFEIAIANPRCLSIGLGTDGYLNIYLGDLGEAVVISFLEDRGPRLERYPIPVISGLGGADISIDAEKDIHVLAGGIDIEIPTDRWAADADVP